MVLLSGDGYCEEEFGEEGSGEEERGEEYEGGGADEPVLAGVYAGSGEGSGGERELQAEGEADFGGEEGGFEGGGCFEGGVEACDPTLGDEAAKDGAPGTRRQE